MTQLTKRGNGGITRFPSSLSEFFDTDRFFPDFQGIRFSSSVPSVNIKENANEFMVEMAAPGLKKDDFKINVENNTLTISSEKEESREDESKDERYTRREYSYSSFSRSFTLPEQVKSDDIQARYTDGVLRINLPKKEEAKKRPPREIKVG